MLTRSGITEFIWEDWVAATIELLQDLQKSLSSDQNSLQLLENAFNDEQISLPMISHFRVSSSSNPQTN